MTGTVAQEIESLLRTALHPTHLDVINDSALHHGHSGDDGSGESHFTVVIESPAFEGVSRLQRQRMRIAIEDRDRARQGTGPLRRAIGCHESDQVILGRLGDRVPQL